MKQTLSILLLPIVLLLAGCSDNPSGPVQTTPVTDGSQGPSPAIQQLLPLEGIVHSQKSDDKDLYHEINGLITYELSFITPFSQKELVDVTLNMEAKLVQIYGQGWGYNVIDRSVVRVQIDQKKNGTFKKRFVVGNNLNLYFIFSLEGRELKVSSIYIEREG